MKICVQGLWHLGSVTAACMASVGAHVTGFDFDAATIEGLANGTPPLFEPGLEELVKQGLASGQLRFSASMKEAFQDIEVLWIAYDTPVDDNDNADTEHVLTEVERTLPHLPADVTVLISSQLPVGSVRRLEATARARFPEKNLTFACSPENLRLGRAIEAFLRPDRIVVGVRVPNDRERVSRLLRPIAERVEWMSVESAEMTKHAINAFLATSISFSNELAAICEKVGADAKDVERGLKSESRIGPKAYLAPGAAFAGGTLARDIAFLTKIGAENALTTPLLSAVKPSNDNHKQWIRRKLLSLLPDLGRSRIAIWGLTYKPGTDSLRRSLSVELCNWLIAQGAQVSVHDPVVKQLPLEWSTSVVQSADPFTALKGARALVISTEWPEYKSITSDAVVDLAPGLVIVDANRFLPHLASDHRLRYMAVGTPE